jgi:hypothetical protein
MEKKNFFKSDTERQLWIKLNAERIRYDNNITNRIVDEDLGSIDKQYSPMWISNNQLEYDEHERQALRFSFEELLTLTPQELYKLAEERNLAKIKTLFENISGRMGM